MQVLGVRFLTVSDDHQNVQEFMFLDIYWQNHSKGEKCRSLAHVFAMAEPQRHLYLGLLLYW